MVLGDLPGSLVDVLGLGGVGGAVDLKPELGNPVRAGAVVTRCGCEGAGGGLECSCLKRSCLGWSMLG